MRFLALLIAICPNLALSASLSCSGTHPNWAATLSGPSATFQLRDRQGAYEIKLTTPAQNDPDTTAYTLIGATDTAILIVHPGRCNTLSHQAHILTQERSQAILLSGCCSVSDQ